jgi:NDP-sugar pyrophosphorylase family protein
VVDPSALELVPDSGEFPITDLFESLLKAKKRVGVFYFNDYWLDVGQPSDLRSAHGNF